MVKGLDDLLQFLVKQIALHGETGVTPSDIRQFASSFYNKAAPNRDHALISIDGPFLAQLWSWLVKHPEVCLRTPIEDVPNWTLEQVEAFNVQSSSCDSSKEAKISKHDGLLERQHLEVRLLASEKQMWIALTGHGPDPKRVPPLEFSCLSAIGAYGESGVIQPVLVRLTGQDKRSLPERTNRLAEKGYIVKRKVLSQGSVTSLCMLKQFATEDLPNNVDVEGYEGSWVKHRFATHEEMIKDALELIQTRGVVTWVDLRALLDIPLGSIVGKRVLQALRRFEYLGCIERVLSRHYPALEVISQRTYRSFQAIRSITEDDWSKFYSYGRENPDWLDISRAVKLNKDDADVTPDNDNETYNDEVGADEDESDEEFGFDSGGQPLWHPDRNLANICFDAVAKASSTGLITTDACEIATGSFCRRSTAGLLHALSNAWFAERPIELTILRDAVFLGRKSAYKYYTFKHFASAVNEGLTSWDAISRKKPSKEDCEDEFMFPQIPKSLFYRSNGMATPGEAARLATKQAKTKNYSTSFQMLLTKGIVEPVTQKKSATHEPTSQKLTTFKSNDSRKYAIEYTEEELNAMSAEKSRKIRNSVAMGRRYHMKKHQARIDTGIRNGISFQEIADAIERELEDAEQTSGLGIAMRLDVLYEIMRRNSSNHYQPSRAAHSLSSFQFLASSKVSIANAHDNLKSQSLDRKHVNRSSASIKFDPLSQNNLRSFETAVEKTETTSKSHDKPRYDQHGEPNSCSRTLQQEALTVEMSSIRKVSMQGRASGESENSLSQPARTRSGRQCKQTTRVQGFESPFTTQSASEFSEIYKHASQFPIKTYEEQYSMIKHTNHNLSVSFPSRLAKTGRGARPKSLLLVFKNLGASPTSTYTSSLKPIVKEAPVNIDRLDSYSYRTQEIVRVSEKNDQVDENAKAPVLCTEDIQMGVDNVKNRQNLLPENTESCETLNKTLENSPSDGNKKAGELPSSRFSSKGSSRETYEKRSRQCFDDPGLTSKSSPSVRSNAGDKSLTVHNVELLNSDASTPVLHQTSGITKSTSSHKFSQNKTRTNAAPNGVSRYGGSRVAAKKEVIMKIMKMCGDVFPGDREMWYPFTAQMIRQGNSTRPDVRTVLSVVKQLLGSNRLRKVTFNFQKANSAGIIVTQVKSILMLPEILPDDPKVIEMRNEIIKHFPRLYIPADAGLDDTFQRHRESWWKPGQPRTGWATRTVDAPRSSLPMPPEDPNVVPNSGAKRAVGRLNGWQKRTKYRERSLKGYAGSTHDWYDDDEVVRSDDFNTYAIGDGYFLFRVRQQDTHSKEDLEGALHPLGQSFSQSKHSINHKSPVETAEQLAVSVTSEHIDAEKQRRIDRLTALNLLPKLNIDAKGIRTSKPLRHMTSNFSFQLRNPALPRSSMPARLPRNDQSKETYSTVSSNRPSCHGSMTFSRHSLQLPRTNPAVTNQDQVFFPNIRCFGSFLQEPTWFIPTSLEDILGRSWPGKVTKRMRIGDSVDNAFYSILNRVQQWEQDDPSAIQEVDGSFRFIHIDPLVGRKSHLLSVSHPASVRKVIQSPALVNYRGDFGFDRVERSKRRVLNDVQDDVPNKRRRIQTIKPSPSKDDMDIVIAVAIARSLFQAGDERFTNWHVVSLLLANSCDSDGARRKWLSLKLSRDHQVSKLSTQFEEAYLRAYEADALPELRYNNYEGNDWASLMSWARETLSTPSKPENMNRSPAFSLPASREKFDERFDFKLQKDDTWKDMFEIKQKSVKASLRREVLHLSQILQRDDIHNSSSPPYRVNNASVAISWVRANVLTPPEKYDKIRATSKLCSVPELDVEKAMKKLTDQKLLITTKSRDSPGKVFDISEKFVNNFRVSLEVENFQQALKFKKWLDVQFDRGTTPAFDFHAEEGSALAFLNLLADGAITATATGVKTDHMDQQVSTYRTRKIDKEQLHFTVKLHPTRAYFMGNPLSPLPPKPRGFLQTDESGIDKTPLPAWIDIHDNEIGSVWRSAICMLLAIIVARPGFPINTLTEYVKPSMETWEVRLLMEWMVLAGAAIWEDGQNKSIRLRPWWWMVLDDYNWPG